MLDEVPTVGIPGCLSFSERLRDVGCCFLPLFLGHAGFGQRKGCAHLASVVALPDRVFVWLSGCDGHIKWLSLAAKLLDRWWCLMSNPVGLPARL